MSSDQLTVSSILSNSGTGSLPLRWRSKGNPPQSGQSPRRRTSLRLPTLRTSVPSHWLVVRVRKKKRNAEALGSVAAQGRTVSAHTADTHSAGWVHGQRRRALALGQLVARGGGGLKWIKTQQGATSPKVSQLEAHFFFEACLRWQHTRCIKSTSIHSYQSELIFRHRHGRVSPCFSECVPTFYEVEIRTASWRYPKSTRTPKNKHWCVRRRTGAQFKDFYPFRKSKAMSDNLDLSRLSWSQTPEQNPSFFFSWTLTVVFARHKLVHWKLYILLYTAILTLSS